MSIFEKIKQIFNNIRNKPKLLENPEDSNFTIPDEVMSKLEQFEYQDDLIEKVLEAFGAHENITNNPEVIKEIKSFLSQKISVPSIEGIPSKEQIEEIKNFISEIMCDVPFIRRIKEFSGRVHLNNTAAKTGKLLYVNKQNGIEQLFNGVHGMLAFQQCEDNNNVIKADFILSQDFSLEQDREINYSSENIYVLNENGILLEKQVRRYNGLIPTSSSSVLRDKENPCIFEVCDSSGKKGYYIPNRLIQLEELMFSSKAPTFFESRKEAIEYFNKNKDSIMESYFSSNYSDLSASELEFFEPVFGSDVPDSSPAEPKKHKNLLTQNLLKKLQILRMQN